MNQPGQTIEVIVSPTGESRVETKGFTGSSCREASRFLETALGEPGKEELKPEFYQVAQENTQNQQRQ